ncbi:MAG TPA: hypothetical protein DDZ51_15180 [Planctomycetaceae bacterium]|nr:hypothetical protein [Planctomycetaceae bacterium]
MLPFLTAYDPLGGSSGSIDPLGALQTYGLLADLLLPGVTTITTRSRYLSMLCAALANAEKHRNMLPGASGLAQRRRAVEPFERLWALACVAARENGHQGAADGLRGITYAEKSYHSFAGTGNKVNCDFRMLKFQARTGAVGTYWTAMVGGQLVHADSGALTAEGIEIAEYFPELRLESKDQAKFADPESAHRVSLPLEVLREWSEKCHLKAASPKECQQLGEALTADDRRECISRALAMMAGKIPEVWETSDLKRLAKPLTTLPRAVELGLPVVIDAIVVTEQFHEAVLRAFETLLWWGTENAGKPLADLIVDSDFRKASDLCRGTAQKLRGFRERCERLDVRDAIESMAGFCFQIDRCHSERELVTELLDRHHRVQSGKVDGGMPKRDWIGWDSTALLRPSPRFQRKDRPALAAGLSLTHPYRFEPFVFMLRENGVLAQN